MATNRIDILDSALLRPGRIDRKIEFPPPNEEARLDILKIHSRKMNLTRGINLRKIAELMPGASGAEVKVRDRVIRIWVIVPRGDAERGYSACLVLLCRPTSLCPYTCNCLGTLYI